jgi:hypothetical protein
MLPLGIPSTASVFALCSLCDGELYDNQPVQYVVNGILSGYQHVGCSVISRSINDLYHRKGKWGA